MMKKVGMKIFIGVFALLLVASAGGLMAKYTGWNLPTSQDTVTVPEELLQQEEETEGLVEGNLQTFAQPGDSSVSNTPQASAGEAATVELYQGNAEVNRRFEVGNMLPGDTETGYFCVKVHHQKELSLFFNTEVTEETQNLGNALFVKVTNMSSGEVLCDAPFSQVAGKEFSTLLPKADSGETVVYYRVDVYTDTSMGNEYQGAALKADLNWYVKDDGSLTPPQTGDTPLMVLWVVLAVSCVALIVLLWSRSRKEDTKNG